MLSYSVDETRLTICRMAGRVEFLPVAQTLERLIEDPAARRARGTLLRIQDTDAFISLTAMKPLLALVRHWGERSAGQRCAIVAPTSLALALTQATLPVLNLNLAEIRCFLTENEALRWLEHGLPTEVPAEPQAELQPASTPSP